jgi:hypothetical protein
LPQESPVISRVDLKMRIKKNKRLKKLKMKVVNKNLKIFTKIKLNAKRFIKNRIKSILFLLNKKIMKIMCDSENNKNIHSFNKNI